MIINFNLNQVLTDEAKSYKINNDIGLNSFSMIKSMLNYFNNMFNNLTFINNENKDLRQILY
jgi:hypothetical protein